MTVRARQEAIAYMNEMGREGKPFLFIVNFKGDKACLCEPGEVDGEELLYDFNGFTNQSAPTAGKLPLEWSASPVSFDVYKKAFDRVQREIREGNTYLLNLTFPAEVVTNLSLKAIFSQAEARYKLWVKDQFVCFSPEIFVRIEDGFIRSFPMKGTIDADLPDAAGRVLSDEKEAAEHATIVDLIRNDLSRIATSVYVKRYRYLDRLNTNCGRLLQVSSEVGGRMPADWQSRIGDLFFALLPAGSVSGAPKRKTLEIIRSVELDERGFYTGVAGYFDGQRLDSTVLIRFVEQQGAGFRFRSGGGITSQSDALQEYAEIKQKIYVPLHRNHTD